jgi:hypothetical protein
VCRHEMIKSHAKWCSLNDHGDDGDDQKMKCFTFEKNKEKNKTR